MSNKNGRTKYTKITKSIWLKIDYWLLLPKMPIRSIALIVYLLFVSACSSRVVFEPTRISSPVSNSVNINTASIDEFENLPHIGRKTAEAILVFREENGPFRRVEHLMLIKGVSEKRFDELRLYLRAE